VRDFVLGQLSGEYPYPKHFSGKIKNQFHYLYERIPVTKPMKFTPYKVAILVLTVIIALIHISLLFPHLVYILNGIGYLVLLLAYLTPVSFFIENHSLIRKTMIGYTWLTIVAWIAIGSNPPTLLGLITTIMEIILSVCLLSDRE